MYDDAMKFADVLYWGVSDLTSYNNYKPRVFIMFYDRSLNVLEMNLNGWVCQNI